MDKEELLGKHNSLIAKGWTKMFTVEDSRVSDLKRQYEDLGFDVFILPGAPDDGQECRGCLDMAGFGDFYKTIYTKGEEKRSDRSDDELFE
jgi:hypothetical protein